MEHHPDWIITLVINQKHATATELADPRLTQWKQKAMASWHMTTTVNKDKTTGI